MHLMTMPKDQATFALRAYMHTLASSRTRPTLPCLGGLLVLLAIAGCRTTPQLPTPPDDASIAPVVAPTTTRGEFSIAADKLDTWNAVGQIVVRTTGARYEGRAQMLDLYSVRYRGEPFLLITRALTLSDAIRVTTTRVTAKTLDGKPIDSPASADLLALLQRELPAEIERVRAQQAQERARTQENRIRKKTPSKTSRQHR